MSTNTGMSSGEPEKPVVNKITDATDKVTGLFSQWWSLTTADTKPKVNLQNLVTVDQLPLYAEDSTPIQYVFVEETPLPLQREFACIRKSTLREFERVKAQFAFVDTGVNKVKSTANTVNRYVQDEWTVLPKAAAITVGGMAGFVIGLKRGSFGRFLSTGTGLFTMAAFCYPHETVDVVRTGVAHSEQAWHSFTSSPEPPAPSK